MGSHAWKLGGLILVVLLLWGCNEAPPQAKNGVMDLRIWDFQTQGPLSLNGDWDFYWEELISPRQFVAGDPVPRSGFHRFPGCWNGKKVGEKSLAGRGYATFRLKVLLPQDETPKAIRILKLSSAYRLWIDGKEVAKNGVVGTSRETSRGQYYLQEEGFMHTLPQLDLVLQVANFEHRKGGIWHGACLGYFL